MFHLSGQTFGPQCGNGATTRIGKLFAHPVTRKILAAVVLLRTQKCKSRSTCKKKELTKRKKSTKETNFFSPTKPVVDINKRKVDDNCEKFTIFDKKCTIKMLQRRRWLREIWFSAKHFFLSPKKSYISKYFVSIWHMGKLANRPKIKTDLW